MNQYTTVISDSSLVTPSYDLNHNLTNDGKFVYSWNSENQLTAVRKASDNSLVAEYFYDPIGRRIQKTLANGTKTTYFHDTLKWSPCLGQIFKVV